MALIATVTKKLVSEVMSKMWHITMNLVLTDDSVEVLTKDYPVKYRAGDSISSKTERFIDLMQYDIDKYKGEQNIFNHAQLDTAVTNVQAGLEV